MKKAPVLFRNEVDRQLICPTPRPAPSAFTSAVRSAWTFVPIPLRTNEFRLTIRPPWYAPFGSRGAGYDPLVRGKLGAEGLEPSHALFIRQVTSPICFHAPEQGLSFPFPFTLLKGFLRFRSLRPGGHCGSVPGRRFRKVHYSRFANDGQRV